MRKLLGGMAFAMIMASGVAVANDAALIIGNGDYQSLQRVRSAGAVVNAADEFRDNEFTVIAREDATAAQQRDGLRRLIESSVPAERVLVVLSGRFVHSSQDSWLLPVDARSPQSLATADESGLALSSVLAVLAEHPGKALLLLATDENSGPLGAPYLSRGIGALDVPQGVTVFAGGPRAIASFVEDVLPLPAASQTLQVARRQGFNILGYTPADFSFMPEEEPQAAVGAAPSVEDENTAWQRASGLDTISAYRAYLDRFPQGENAIRAEAMIREIQTEPNRAARKGEEALSLSRDQRREVQQDLSILDYDPRGIDGLFGPGSRNAISRWQRQNGFPANGYLSREQVVRLDAQAERRAAELEAEAEARRLEEEALDRAYWQESGAAGDEAGLRVYLKRYPDGLFAEVAQGRLDAIKDQKLRAAAAKDRVAWDKASTANSVESYRDYLAAFPDGVFAEEAKAKIDELTETSDKQAVIAAAKQTEQQLGLSKSTRMLIERRLAALELKPGKVDGEFNDATRRAIRRFQKSRSIPVTGYLDQNTVVRLLAGVVLR